MRRPILAIWLLPAPVMAQLTTPAFHPDSVNRAWLVQATGAASLPGGALSQRFGVNGLAGVGVGWKSAGNWLFEFQSRFLFGSGVREDSILRHISTDSGFVIGLDGLLYQPFLYERGFLVHAGVAKIIRVTPRYPNAGIFLGGGLSFLQHKILYSLKPEENFPQLNNEMRKGYDRLTNGFGFTQEVGWHHMSRNGLINFRVGIEAAESFTRNRRPFNFDTGMADTERRVDMLFSLKAVWYLPIWVRHKDAVIYYK